MKVKNIEHLDIIKLCNHRGLHMTKQRKIIASIINKSKDHPDVETIYFRLRKENKNISLATVYRTVKLFEDANVIIKHEPTSKWEHNHLLDISTGEVKEFQNPGFEKLSKKIAEKMGYKVVGYKLELFGIKEACSKFKINKE